MSSVNYLVAASNALHGSVKLDYSHDSIRYTQQSAFHFSNIACRALKELSRDEKTIHAITDAINSTAEHASEISSYEAADFFSLLEEFRHRDQALMVAAGMDPAVAEFLFRDVESLYDYLHNSKTYSVGDISGMIGIMSETICSDSLVVTAEQSRFDNAMNFIGGAAIVTVNAAADLTLGPFFQLWSSAFGGHKLVEAWEKFPRKSYK